jgi:hypothetical protein
MVVFNEMYGSRFLGRTQGSSATRTHKTLNAQASLVVAVLKTDIKPAVGSSATLEKSFYLNPSSPLRFFAFLDDQRTKAPSRPALLASWRVGNSRYTSSK